MALATLRTKIEALGLSENPGDVFAQADTEDLLNETKRAFGLSIQSFWERQLRAYLTGCATELRPGDNLAGKVAKAEFDRAINKLKDIGNGRFGRQVKSGLPLLLARSEQFTSAAVTENSTR